ncbi:hypothetical protein GJ496_010885 [Pomphorhynchus laevis]|nr:hypothetical protein GJ496_010885 [Pomphorhynchus laevis]
MSDSIATTSTGEIAASTRHAAFVDPEKLQKLAEATRIGGKGTPRRRVKRVHRTNAGDDDKKLNATLKRLAMNTITGLDEVNMFKEDGKVLHFATPKVQASISSNTFCVSGNCETTEVTKLLPGIISQLGPEILMKNLMASRKANEDAATVVEASEDANNDDDIPELITGDFEEIANRS